VLIFTASEVETATLGAGISPAFAGLFGGMAGGVAQAYATMGKFPSCIISQVSTSSSSTNLIMALMNRLHHLHENRRDHSS
jgi:hypothetical protein